MARAQLESWYMTIWDLLPLSHAGRRSMAMESAPIGIRHVERAREVVGLTRVGVWQYQSEKRASFPCAIVWEGRRPKMNSEYRLGRSLDDFIFWKSLRT